MKVLNFILTQCCDMDWPGLSLRWALCKSSGGNNTNTADQGSHFSPVLAFTQSTRHGGARGNRQSGVPGGRGFTSHRQHYGGGSSYWEVWARQVTGGHFLDKDIWCLLLSTFQTPAATAQSLYQGERHAARHHPGGHQVYRQPHSQTGEVQHPGPGGGNLENRMLRISAMWYNLYLWCSFEDCASVCIYSAWS